MVTKTLFLPERKSSSFVLGLTLDRIYSLLENCVDEQFLLCLLSLLRNLLDEKDTDTLLPMLNSVKLLSVGEMIDR